MGAAYDRYDYSAYWAGRSYEHHSEIIALKSLLQKIPKIRKVIDIGAGFGRLTPIYAFRAKKVILSEPSARLLRQARGKLAAFPNIEFVQSNLANLQAKVPKSSADLVIMIRVSHHLTNLESSFAEVKTLLKPGGYLILEFANKLHLKSILRHIFRGDFAYISDTTSVDVRSQAAIKKRTIVFFNHHPALVEQLLDKTGFATVEKLSVSNFRSPFLKKFMPLDLLLTLESALQRPLGFINFGPSIFVLAQRAV